MVKYTVKRLLILIPILIGVAFIIFTIMDFTPGDPAIRILGPESSVEAREQLRVELGLDQPFWIRFFEYVKDVVTDLDFGESYRTGNPVFEDIFDRVPVSLGLFRHDSGYSDGPAAGSLFRSQAVFKI